MSYKTIKEITKLFPHLDYQTVYRWARSTPKLCKKVKKKIKINVELFTELTKGGTVKPKKGGINEGYNYTSLGGVVTMIDTRVNFDKKPKGKGTITKRGTRYTLLNFPLFVTVGGETVYATFTQAGAPTVGGKCKSFRADTEQAVINKQQELISYRDDVYANKTPITQVQPFADDLIRFYVTYMKENHSQERQRAYINWTEKQVRPHFKELTVQDITLDMLQDFVNKQTAARNYRDRKSLIDKYYHRCVVMDVIARNLAELITIPKNIDNERKKNNSRPKFVPTTEQMNAFANAVMIDDDARFCVPTLLLLHTGMRPGELLAVRWEDVDADGCFITVRGSWNSKTSRLTDGKNGCTQRVVAFSGVIQPLVQLAKERALRKGWQFLIESKNGTPIQDKYFREYYKSTAKRVGLPNNFLPYSCRHYFASVGYQKYIHNLQALAQQLGHKDLRMLMKVYAKHNINQERVTLDALTFDNLVPANGCNYSACSGKIVRVDFSQYA